jgi:hypothetical protein
MQPNILHCYPSFQEYLQVHCELNWGLINHQNVARSPGPVVKHWHSTSSRWHVLREGGRGLACTQGGRQEVACTQGGRTGGGVHSGREDGRWHALREGGREVACTAWTGVGMHSGREDGDGVHSGRRHSGREEGTLEVASVHSGRWHSGREKARTQPWAGSETRGVLLQRGALFYLKGCRCGSHMISTT